MDLVFDPQAVIYIGSFFLGYKTPVPGKVQGIVCLDRAGSCQTESQQGQKITL